MARKSRMDKGLYSKEDSQGKLKWCVRLYHDGRDRRFEAFKTKTQAREFYEKAKQEQREGRFFPERYQHGGYQLVKDHLNQYLESLQGSGKTLKTQCDEKFYGVWWKQRIGGKRLNQITPSELEAAMRTLFAIGYSPQTVMHYLKFLRHVLNIAIRDGKLDRNPFIRVKLPKLSPGRTRFLSPEEETTLLKELGPVYGPWARLAILTGMRKSELFSLRWSDVDLDCGLLTIPQTKSGKVQYVHLNDEAQSILRSFDSWERSIWVFPSQKRGSHLDSYNFYGRVFRPAVKRSKLEDVTWHTLRHTFASRLAMNGQSESTIATLLRHSNTSLVQRYAHLSPTHLKAAVEGVANFGKSQDKDSKEKVMEMGQASPASNPTVTKTGTEAEESVSESA